jgi:hypothetical protein
MLRADVSVGTEWTYAYTKGRDFAGLGVSLVAEVNAPFCDQAEEPPGCCRERG